MEPVVKHLFRLALVSLFAGAGFELAAMNSFLLPGGGNGAFASAGATLITHGFAATALLAFMYHMLPKFMGSFLRSKGLVTAHLALAAAGVALFSLTSCGVGLGRIAAESRWIPVGGLLLDAGFLVGATNLLLSFNPKAPPAGPVIRN